MKEIMIKTHLIVKDIQNEYKIKWLGNIVTAKPIFENDKPIFILISKTNRIELNTTNMKYIEQMAKRMTQPKGRQAFTSDTVTIYIKEIDGNQKKVGTVTHNKIKKFAPMYDSVGYKD